MKVKDLEEKAFNIECYVHFMEYHNRMNWYRKGRLKDAKKSRNKEKIKRAKAMNQEEFDEEMANLDEHKQELDKKVLDIFCDNVPKELVSDVLEYLTKYHAELSLDTKKDLKRFRKIVIAQVKVEEEIHDCLFSLVWDGSNDSEYNIYCHDLSNTVILEHLAWLNPFPIGRKDDRNGVHFDEPKGVDISIDDICRKLSEELPDHMFVGRCKYTGCRNYVWKNGKEVEH